MLHNAKSEIVNELFKPLRKNFQRRRVIIKNINDLFQSDLISLFPHAKLNKNYKYILLVINCFSKFIWLRKLKTKSGNEVSHALNNIFKSTSPPRLFQTDMGKEYYNIHVKNVLKKYNIKHYSSFSDLKASIAERANKSILQILYKLMSIKGTEKWSTLLDEVASIYNNRIHRSIKEKPILVTKKNEKIIFKNLFPAINNKQKLPKFKQGDIVRIARKTEIFDKSFLINWSFELFKIKNVYKTFPYVYEITDLTDNLITGKFYEFELQKTKFPDVYLVEKVLKRKKNKMYVKYLGFDSSNNSWVNKNDVML